VRGPRARAPSLVPSLVPPEGLATANAQLELARTAAFVGGPAVAGALVGWTGASAAFGLAVALSTAGVILLGGLREPARAVVASGHPLADLGEGAGLMLRHSLLLPILITQFVFNTAFFVLQAVYVPYAVHHLASPRPTWASRSAPTGWAWCWARSWPAA